MATCGMGTKNVFLSFSISFFCARQIRTTRIAWARDVFSSANASVGRTDLNPITACVVFRPPEAVISTDDEPGGGGNKINKYDTEILETTPCVGPISENVYERRIATGVLIRVGLSSRFYSPPAYVLSPSSSRYGIVFVRDSLFFQS